MVDSIFVEYPVPRELVLLVCGSQNQEGQMDKFFLFHYPQKREEMLTSPPVNVLSVGRPTIIPIKTYLIDEDCAIHRHMSILKTEN